MKHFCLSPCSRVLWADHNSQAWQSSEN
uniref:Uncharacterized protein n=1 Tax=Arundo donax TaxID=35708 RepID=A0A0A9H9F5_ARUDO